MHHAPATARAPRVCTLVPFITTETKEEEEPLSEVVLLRRQNAEWREKCQKLEVENMELKERLEEWREGEDRDCKEAGEEVRVQKL